MHIVWTDYIKYRASLRGFDLNIVQQIVKYSTERYNDLTTGRRVVIGNHRNNLVLIPYETDIDTIIPITIHVTSRQQIRNRLRTGRYTHE